jgi:hypothetical protein
MTWITAIRCPAMSDSSAPAVCDRLICGMTCLFYGAIPDTKSPAADTSSLLFWRDK